MEDDRQDLVTSLTLPLTGTFDAITAELGSVMMFSHNIDVTPACSDRIFCRALLAGEPCFRLRLSRFGEENDDDDDDGEVAFVTLRPSYPTERIMSVRVLPGETVIVKRGSWIGNRIGNRVGSNNMVESFKLQSEKKNCCCGGCCFPWFEARREFVVPNDGSEATLYVKVGQEVVHKELVEGEEMLVDAEAVVLRDGSVTAGKKGGLLTGPGRVFLETMSRRKLRTVVGGIT